MMKITPLKRTIIGIILILSILPVSLTLAAHLPGPLPPAPPPILVNERMEQGKNKRVRWVTIRAKDNSYHKSFVGETTSNNTRTVFGIIYRNQKAYERYRPDYLKFKKSLVQVAD